MNEEYAHHGKRGKGRGPGHGRGRGRDYGQVSGVNLTKRKDTFKRKKERMRNVKQLSRIFPNFGIFLLIHMDKSKLVTDGTVCWSCDTPLKTRGGFTRTKS